MSVVLIVLAAVLGYLYGVQRAKVKMVAKLVEIAEAEPHRLIRLGNEALAAREHRRQSQVADLQ